MFMQSLWLSANRYFLNVYLDSRPIAKTITEGIGPRRNKRQSFQVWGFHYKDKTVVKPSYLYHVNPYTGMVTKLPSSL